MAKIKVICEWCGKEFLRYASSVRGKVFCNSDCSSKYKSKKHNPENYTRHAHLTELNVKLNPTRMTEEVKEKVRQSRLEAGKDKTKAYKKTNGRHTHRVVAEEILGRRLKKGEVVHHIDENIMNNSPENIIIFASQADHARHHMLLRWKKGGDAL